MEVSTTVGYVLPVACCVAGACMSCYGCYRYYRANELRRRRLQRIQMEVAQFPENMPRLKRDTLKRKMLKAFSKLSSSKDTDALGGKISAVSLKDMQDACPICIDAYEGDPQNIFIGLVKSCGHYYHFECLWNWLELNQTCPICRIPCNLAEPDLQGVSLEQVLKIAVIRDDLNNANPVGDNSEIQTVTLRFQDTASQTGSLSGGHECSLSRDSSISSNSRGGIVTTTVSVITSQPQSTSRPRGSTLIERMKQRFEGAHSDEEGPSDTGANGNPASGHNVSSGVSNPSYE